MEINDHQNVRWLKSAWESAHRHGLNLVLSDLAVRYLSGHPTTTYPDPAGRGRVRVVAEGLAVVLAPDGVVLGYDADLDHDYSPQDPAPRSTLPRRRGRSGSTGPADIAELLTLARAEGAQVTRVPGGHWRIEANGRSVQVPSTPRSEAGVRNATSRVRRVLGLRLRRGQGLSQ